MTWISLDELALVRSPYANVEQAFQRVLSDECEPVSVRAPKVRVMPYRVGATQRERWFG